MYRPSYCYITVSTPKYIQATKRTWHLLRQRRRGLILYYYNNVNHYYYYKFVLPKWFFKWTNSVNIIIYLTPLYLWVECSRVSNAAMCFGFFNFLPKSIFLSILVMLIYDVVVTRLHYDVDFIVSWRTDESVDEQKIFSGGGGSYPGPIIFIV